MRKTIPATLVALGCLMIHAFGCSDGSSTNTAGGTQGASSGTGGMGGSAGEGGAGGSACVPAAEVCDGMDNDCDMQVDEDCPCSKGQTQACYSGAAGTDGVGPCSKGQQTCDLMGKWGECVGEVVPKKTETCNNVDDDCNGSVDDMGTISCGVGACLVENVPKCTNGTLNACVPKPPALEVCDGVDNDCDQLTDEVFPDKGSPCDTGLFGPCGTGKKSCASGAPVCLPDIMPVTETCNGIDDDCDGQLDEDLPGTGGLCSTGYPGICSNGAIQCNGTTIDCFPIIPQQAEKCNGLDDDCDGVVDEGDPEGGLGCNSGGVGACGVGTTHCVNAMITCTPNSMGTPEQCNGLDDNCDGTIDEGNPGGGAACGCGGTQVCALGKLACQGGPAVYLQEDFTDAPGWVTGTQWEIKSTPPATTCGDPTLDVSPSADNILAGVIVGGCAPATAHAYYYLTSPAFDASMAPSLFLQLRRWLRSDSVAVMSNVIEVYDGANWVQVWQGNPVDSAWQKVTYDIGAYKNAAMKVRFGFSITGSGAFQVGSWNVDDVVVATAPCQ